MTLQTPPSQSSPDVIAELGEFDDCLVREGVELTHTGLAHAIAGTGSNQAVIVHGFVSAARNTIQLCDNVKTDFGSEVHVGATGWVFGGNIGVAILGNDARIVNEGLISSSNIGVMIGGTDPNTISVLRNSGIVAGQWAGMYTGGVTETLRVINTGSIAGNEYSYQGVSTFGHSGRDLIVNKGNMNGDVTLDSGNDLYDGRTGLLQGAAHGGGGRDRLFGGSEANVLFGDGGRDEIAGGLGADFLTGGEDRDTFVFRAIGDSSLRHGGRDIIEDFQNVFDSIDLSVLDANIRMKGNQRFEFIGRDEFSGDASELRYRWELGNTFIDGDVDGDGEADLSVQLNGQIDLATGNFEL